MFFSSSKGIYTVYEGLILLFMLTDNWNLIRIRILCKTILDSIKVYLENTLEYTYDIYDYEQKKQSNFLHYSTIIAIAYYA